MDGLEKRMDDSGRDRPKRTVLYRRLGLPVGWLDGSRLFERRLLGTRHVDLAAAQRVRLLANNVGGVYLAVEDREGRWAGCHVLVIGLNSARHLSADVLERISLTLAPSGAPNIERVCSLLEEQARYLRTGQGLAGSPLRTHSEWVAEGLGIPQQKVARLHSRDPYATVRRDDPEAPQDGVR
jgi:hypothetical protein